MTGNLLRAICLTTYGTAFLKGNYDINGLTLDHPAFVFENKVEFIFYKRHWFLKPTWHNYADSPVNWLQKLKADGCNGLRLVHQYNNTRLDGAVVPDHKLAGFVGGGGLWMIEAGFKTHTDIWSSRETVTHKSAADHRIWTVVYARLAANRDRPMAKRYDVVQIKERLRESLTAISIFAREQNFPFWSDWFAKAIDWLDAPLADVTVVVKDLIPFEHYSVNAIQLLAAANKAWCFGGMGSWNDVVFDDKASEAVYDQLSASLFDALTKSYIAAANSYGVGLTVTNSPIH